MFKLKELAARHPYYCSDRNYYNNSANEHYVTATDFLDDFEDADVDLNLCFRFDVRQKEDEDGNWIIGDYCAEVFLMLQRKGIFKPCYIESIKQAEVSRFENYLFKHYQTLQNMWAPFASED